MTTVTTPTAVALKGVPDVELVAVGKWNAGTGVARITDDDVRAAVAALDCPGIRNPVIKLGHQEPDPDATRIRWDGEPAVGWISNMRLSDNGAKVLGDYTGVPAWLVDVMPSAYPQRSVEIQRDFLCQIGHVHPFVITAVSLLGVAPPAVGVIKSLHDVQALYTLAAADGHPPAEVTTSIAHALALPADERRPLTETEIRSGADFDRDRDEWDAAVAALLAAYGVVQRRQREQLTAQIAPLVDAGRYDQLAGLTVDPQPAADMIYAEMLLAATAAIDLQIIEAATQGVIGLTAMPDEFYLRRVAEGIAATMAATMAATAGRDAAQLAAPGVTGQSVADGVDAKLSDLSDRFLRDQFAGAIGAARTAGRHAVLSVAPDGTYYAAEVNDRNTCPACKMIDGTRFPNLDAAMDAYGAGGYHLCSGGQRCRGRMITVWEAATGPQRFTAVAVRIGGRFLLGSIAREVQLHLPGRHDQDNHGSGGGKTGVALSGKDALDSVPKGLFVRGSLTPKQRKALQVYDSGWFTVINNSVLREDDKWDDPGYADDVATVRDIDSAMADSALPQDVVAHRGMFLGNLVFGEDRMGHELTGFAWLDKAYGSTSADEAIPDKFMASGAEGNVRMVVNIPAGTRALATSTFEKGSGENGPLAEITLERGLRWTVVKDNGYDDTGTRHLEVRVDPAARNNRTGQDGGADEGLSGAGAQRARQSGRAGTWAEHVSAGHGLTRIGLKVGDRVFLAQVADTLPAAAPAIEAATPLRITPSGEGRTLVLKFDPNQKRAKDGKWTDGPGGGGSSGGSGGGVGKETEVPTGQGTEPMTDAEFEARAEFVSAMIGKARKTLSTDVTHTLPSGAWTPERDKLHREIADDLYSRSNGVPNDGKAVIAGGLGGAGKTTVLTKHAGVDTKQYMTVNPDDIKEEMAARGLIPEVPGAAGLSPMERAALVHEESSRIAHMLADRAYREKRNLIWDITMSSESSVKTRVEAMQKAGYGEVRGVFVDIPVETSVERAMSRYRRGVDKWRAGSGPGGRYVPPAIIRAQKTSGGATINRNVFEGIRGGFTDSVVYDNSRTGEPPRKIG